MIDLFHGAFEIIGADEGAHLEVFLDGHRSEDIVGLRHEAHALDHALLRRQRGDVFAIEQHAARMQVEHAEDGFHRSGFACAIGADDHSNLAGVNGDGTVIEDRGAFAITAGHGFANQERLGHAILSLFLRPVPR